MAAFAGTAADIRPLGPEPVTSPVGTIGPWPPQDPPNESKRSGGSAWESNPPTTARAAVQRF